MSPCFLLLSKHYTAKTDHVSGGNASHRDKGLKQSLPRMVPYKKMMRSLYVTYRLSHHYSTLCQYKICTAFIDTDANTHPPPPQYHQVGLCL